MKKLFLFIAIVFISTFYTNAGTLDGVFGMKFGMSQEEVKQIMLKRSDFPLNKIGNSKEAITYGAGKFAGRDIKILYLKFVDNKLSTIGFIYSIDLESEVVDTYQQIKRELVQKYGESELDIEDYSTPYEQGDGYTESAIRLGKATFLSKWTLGSSTNVDINNNIGLFISTGLSVMLLYQDGKLQKLESESDKEKALNDY